jgi:hypothetical protein
VALALKRAGQLENLTRKILTDAFSDLVAATREAGRDRLTYLSYLDADPNALADLLWAQRRWIAPAQTAISTETTDNDA